MDSVSHQAVSSTPALEGIRVLDFARMLPGPWSTQMLADLGATVIKVEEPGVGDLGRHNPPDFGSGSVYFNTVNLNKKSLTLDLKKDEDRKVAHQLMQTADVVIESFRKGVASRLSIDYETARRLKPDIIYCSISGFGQTGPLSDIPGHDLVVQSMSGVMGVGHRQLEHPAPPGFQAADYAGAAYATIAILSALYRRGHTGIGAYLDISMFDSLISMTNVLSGAALARIGGHEVTSIMELWGRNPRYDVYRTRDGKAVAVSLLEVGVWGQFCRLIGRPDLIFADEQPRDRHTVHGARSASYREAIEAVCLSHDRDDLLLLMRKNDIPITAVFSPDETLASDHAQAREIIEWVDHPAEGRLPVVRNPLSRTGLTRGSRTHAPLLGEHSDAIRANGWVDT
jgi:crotonobetainyl-CoA:carnitine CoA-transferase CaiB-like acyl-CoA transferase